MPAIVQPTLTRLFLERVNHSPDQMAYTFMPTYPEMGAVGKWRSITFKQHYEQVKLASYGLMNLGLSMGGKVAIVSESRYEWTLLDMAILFARGTTVPIYPALTGQDVFELIVHSDTEIVIVEDATQLKKILSCLKDLPHVKAVIVIEPGAIRIAPNESRVLSFPSLTELGRREETKNPRLFEQNGEAVDPSDIATIAYTSGTSGKQKGVILTHDCFASVIEDGVQFFKDSIEMESETILSFLPFSHIIGKVETVFTYTFGWNQTFSRSLENLFQDLQEVKPTILFSVPRIFEKAFQRFKSEIDSSSTIKRALVREAMIAGKHIHDQKTQGRSKRLLESIEYSVLKTILFKQVRDLFGGRMKFALSGGAPLAQDIAEFFLLAGVPILEGYGLTETTAPITLNTVNHVRLGFVGRPMPEVNLKIALDGEILVQSRKVFKGYYKDEEGTKEAFDGKWFKTGDIGYIDDFGFLKITDRKKDIIITSAGKNIAPQRIEGIATQNKFIENFVIVGDRRHYLCALITMSTKEVEKFAKANHILYSRPEELTRHPKVIDLMQTFIDQLNRDLSSFETIKRFVILPYSFTVDSGELTPSMKIRRKFIEQKFNEEIEKMYRGS